MKPIGAKVVLKWDNGRSVEIGTIEINSEDKGTRLKSRVRVAGTRIGWEFVRMGFRIMFPGRKWEEKHGQTDTRD